MVSVTLLLREAGVAGLRVAIDGERLIVRGPRSAQVLARTLLDHKHEVLAALAADQPAVRWRAQAMREQLPRSGPLPFLIVKSFPADLQCCHSCGDPLTPDPDRFSIRCRPCTHAAQLITSEYVHHATDTGNRHETKRTARGTSRGGADESTTTGEQHRHESQSWDAN